MKILFVEERAEEYRELLKDLAQPISFYTEVPNNPACDILVASPAKAKAALEAGSSPRWIQSTWAGVDSLIPAIINKSKDRDIVLTGIKDIFGQLMSEYIFAYILGDLRDLDHFKTLQAQRTWDDRLLPETLHAKRIAIVGTGSIGQHLALTAKHFGMNTIGINRSGSSVDNFDTVTSDLLDAVTAADYIVGCIPSTLDTKQVFNHAFFKAVPSSAIFFNVGRGSSVDDAALIAALNNEHLRAAVLDVFDHEPLPSDHLLWRTNRLTITPHISAPSFPSDIAKIFKDNLTRYENGSDLNYVIDTQRGY